MLRRSITASGGAAVSIPTRIFPRISCQASAYSLRADCATLDVAHRSFFSSSSIYSASAAGSSSASAASSVDVSGFRSRFCAVLGAQWGDEGKGKLVDILASKYDIIARFNGGANAGHTLVVDKKKFAFHLLPCGMLYDGKKNVIGNGVVVDLAELTKELKGLKDGGIPTQNKLLISDRAAVLLQLHKEIDGRLEAELSRGGTSLGTTKRGIGPCYATKALRSGLRMSDLLDWKTFTEKYQQFIQRYTQWFKIDNYDSKTELEQLKVHREQILPMITDTSFYLADQLRNGKTVLAEGANAALLDLDHGTYPFVTSSSTTAGGICTGLGVPPSSVQTTFGVVKAYSTRVGAGPFPTELLDATGEEIRKIGGEFGTTTGRPRRCGWLDIPSLHYSHLLNNYSAINITKLDVFSTFPQIKIGVSYELDGNILPPGKMPASLVDVGRIKVKYETLPGWKSNIGNIRKFEDLPVEAQNYLKRIEQLLGIPVNYVGVGAGREDMATKGFTIPK